MIIKERDVNKARIAYLERLELTENDSDKRSNIRQARARMRANSTTDHACAVIDGIFADSDEWMVLHDLRLTNGKLIFHVNHLLINNALEFFILDSRYIQYGLTVNEAGAWNAHTEQDKHVIASPLNKLNRDLRFLKTYLKTTNILPKHFGVVRPVNVTGYMLVNPAIRSGKARSSNVDTSMLVSPDGFFHTVWKEPGHWLNKRLKPESLENLHRLARKLEDMHESALPRELANCFSGGQVLLQDYMRDTSHCADCGAGVVESVREHCFRNADLYEGKSLCISCQRNYVEPTAIFASF